MKTSPQGRLAILEHEALVLSPYRDSVGVLTVAVGHTASAGLPDPAAIAKPLTIDEALDIFEADLAKVEARVDKAVKVPLDQHEFDALVSFDFNTGAVHRAALVTSLNAGDRAKAAAQFMSWSKPPEIIGRRQKEQALFRDGTYPRVANLKVYDKHPGKAHLVPVPQRLKGAARVKAPAPKPVAADKATITRVQERLVAIGYHEAGKADGMAGRRTEAAILAFRHDNGLPLVVAIDDELLASLMTAPPRVVAKERATATASELREEGSTIMSGAAVQQVAGGTAAAGAVAEGVSRSGVLDTLTGAGEKVEEVTEALSPFQALIAFMSDYVWVAFALIGGIVAWQGWKIAKARLADHRSGKTPTAGSNPVAGTGDGS